MSEVPLQEGALPHPADACGQCGKGVLNTQACGYEWHKVDAFALSPYVHSSTLC